MDIPKVFSKVPKAGYIAGGVAVGGMVLFIRKRNSAATATDTGITADPSVAGQLPSTPFVGSFGATAPQLDTSAIPNSDSGLIASSFQGILDGSNSLIQTLLSSNSDLTTQALSMATENQHTLSDAISAMAAAGSAPQVASQSLGNTAPAPDIAPVTAPPPTNAPAPKKDPCVGTFPFLNEANGKCYRVACVNNGRWHFYSDGTKVRVASC